jgi:hypothetical protein
MALANPLRIQNRVTVINSFNVIAWNAETKSTLFLEIEMCIFASNIFVQQMHTIFSNNNLFLTALLHVLMFKHNLQEVSYNAC